MSFRSRVVVVLFLGLASSTMPACKTTRAVSPADREKAQYQYDLGVAALREQKYRESLAELLKGEQLNPEDPRIQHALGLTYFVGFGRLDDAEKHLKRAIALDTPENKELPAWSISDAQNALGNVYIAKNQCEKAIPLFEKAKSNLLWPTPHLAEQGLGWCLHKTGKTEQGIVHLKTAVNMHPDLCGGYDYLAQIYVDTQRDAEAILWLGRYLKQCDTDRLRKYVPPGQIPGNYYRLGMAQLRTGDREGARQTFATCVERFGQEEAAVACRKNLALLE
ncbi:MAG: tetratricopeptide repeat protein [Myxococcota bacterium]